jgi:hypothetical protein
VRLEASTKPPIHNLIHEFLINMAFTMACPNFKKSLKMAFGPLGVKHDFWEICDFMCDGYWSNYLHKGWPQRYQPKYSHSLKVT